MSYYIGIMSGTSLDGIDIVITDITQNDATLIAQSTTPYSDDIKQKIETSVNSSLVSLHSFCQLDVQIAKAYAKAVNELLAKNNIKPNEITAIGCHGQTIKHAPNDEHAYTLQIGDPNTLAALTDITTVADFRRKDIALGGQAAPLAPAFHQFMFSSSNINRAIVNIGGISNLTILPKDQNIPIIGFDTGPGNTLLDHFCSKYFNLNYDKNGELAALGKTDNNLLNLIIDKETYFSQPPAKSTGTDYFTLDWFSKYLNQFNKTLSPHDQLATLTELTALTITLALKQLSIKVDEIYICGGGAHNDTLVQHIRQLSDLPTNSTETLGLHPDWVEAVAFAWFAKNTLEGKYSNSPTVTSSSRNAILGGIFKA